MKKIFISTNAARSLQNIEFNDSRIQMTHKIKLFRAGSEL